MDSKRDLKSGDLSVLAAMVETRGWETASSTGLAIRPLLLAALTNHRAHCSVVERGSHVVGFAVTGLRPGQGDDSVAVIAALHVVPPAQERGLGAWLVADALEWSRGRGCLRLELVLDPEGQADELEVVRDWGFEWVPGAVPGISLVSQTDLL